MPTINLDMDGTICDMVGAAAARWGRPDFAHPVGKVRLAEALGLDERTFWSRLNDHAFWSTLPKTEICDDLLLTAQALVGIDNVWVCSTPTLSPFSASGKVAWVQAHYAGLDRQYHLTTEKWRCAAPGDVLVDDDEKHEAKWVARGGHFVLVPRPWNRRHAEPAANAVADLKALFAPAEARMANGSVIAVTPAPTAGERLRGG